MKNSNAARIGIFDSGLGGLIITKSILAKLPRYDYIYLGDTKRVPYGNRTQKEIYQFTKQALIYLFSRNCKLVIIACNTSSAKALRKIQKEFLPKNFPDRKVLGVIIPTIETLAKSSAKKIGILSTTSTAKSHAYKKEILKLNPKLKVYEQGAPLLTPLIEDNNFKEAGEALKKYLQPLVAKKVEAIVLGCTHYPILKSEAKKIVRKTVPVISQDEIIPQKLADYLKRHKEIQRIMGKTGQRSFEVTKIGANFKKVSKILFGGNLKFKEVSY